MNGCGNGTDNMPPPWYWLEDPDRTRDLSGCKLTMPQTPNVTTPLVDLYNIDNTLQRFQEVSDILRPVYDEYVRGGPTFSSYPFPAHSLAGYVDAESILDDQSAMIKPFASPRYWAGFIVTGNGTGAILNGDSKHTCTDSI
jgi:hypothetical protein